MGLDGKESCFSDFYSGKLGPSTLLIAIRRFCRSGAPKLTGVFYFCVALFRFAGDVFEQKQAPSEAPSEAFPKPPYTLLFRDKIISSHAFSLKDF